MNTQEVAAVLGVIKTAFPSFGGDCKPEDITNLWARMFANDAPETVITAVERYIQAGRFPPTIADIRAVIANMSASLVTPGEVWQEAHRLLNSGISPDDTEQAYSRMSGACREATLAAGGWYVLSMSPEGAPYIRRAFIQAAQTRNDKDRERSITLGCTATTALNGYTSQPQIGGATNG